MKFLYSIFVYFLEAAFSIFSLFNSKVRKGRQGRKQSLSLVKAAITEQDKVLWMHAASLGEYEQGLPVLEKLKEKYPAHKILVTFFSPSGYENVVKKQQIADVVCYLPFDRASTMSAFVEAVHPEIFFTVKYDFWYHLLAELQQQKAKVFVVSALFYGKQSYFRWYGNWFAQQLKQNVDWFFHQTEASAALATRIGLQNSSISGDTRFDRVRKIAATARVVEGIEAFKGTKKLLVFGSSWEAEEKIAEVVSQKSQDFRIVIAPHDLKRVELLKRLFPQAVMYSELENRSNVQSPPDILIINSIGLLSSIYRYADLALVGGGFHDKGLHNILEAAAYGIPVVFGNRYRKNPEADALIAQGGGLAFETPAEAAEFILMLSEEKMQEMGTKAGAWVALEPKATEIVVEKMTQGQFS